MRASFTSPFPYALLRLPRLNHSVRRLLRIIGQENEIEVARRDLRFAQDARLNPANQSRPIVPAEHDERELIDLARLNERERLERFVERTEAAGKNDERV